MRPWQFFALGALVCATIAVFLIRGTSAENLIFVCLGIFGAALVALAALHTFRPLVTGETREPDMIGTSTRAAIERDKNLVLRAIKELEFDHAMGKVGDRDFADMSGRLRTRAGRLMRQLDAGVSYREEIRREIDRRLASVSAGPDAGSSPSREQLAAPAATSRTCSCGTVNESDARFCKSCGTRLTA